jgi:8-oxo-dGTP pyrophosphatase MutT (NUDIX family)
MLKSGRNPWKTNGTKVVYSNPWITVREDQVVQPSGNPGIYGVVQTRIATGVVAMTTERDIYLVGQYRYATECYSWEIVEGGAERGEEPIIAAKRELVEEAGIEARCWEKLGSEIHLSNCHSDEVAYLFLATGLEEVPRRPEDTEELEIARIPLTAALEMVNTGQITDALSIIAILTVAKRFA